MEIQIGAGWMDVYLKWFRSEQELNNPQEASIFHKNKVRYVLIDNKLFRKGFSTPFFRCVESPQKERIVQDVHE